MTPEQLTALLGNYPGLRLSSANHAPESVRMDGLEPHEWIVKLDWTQTGTRLKLVYAYPAGPWVKATKASVSDAIDSALDALIARHEANLARLKAAKEGKP